MATELFFLRTGNLFHITKDGEVNPFSSPFALEAEKRAEKSRSINAWKEDTSSWGTNFATPQLRQFQQAGEAPQYTRFTNIARVNRSEIAYTLAFGQASGLFRYNLDKKSERRLMHNNDFYPEGLSARASDGLLSFGQATQEGRMGIAVGERDGVFRRKITGGDSRDSLPQWRTENDRDWIYFQSAGLWRSEQGYLGGVGPHAICRIQYNEGEVEIVAESEEYDYLQPKLSSDGTVFCIRRPYQSPRRHQTSEWVILKDIVLFPYRFCRAMFYLANFISILFSKRGLTSEPLDPMNPQSTQNMMLWGRVINTERALRKAGANQRVRLVPNDWQLVKRTGSKEWETIASNVICFDIGTQGEIVYSDGGGIYQIQNGQEEKISSEKSVSQIVIL